MPMENGDKALKCLLEELKITDENPLNIMKQLKSLSSEELLNASKEMRKVFFYLPMCYSIIYVYINEG